MGLDLVIELNPVSTTGTQPAETEEAESISPPAPAQPSGEESPPETEPTSEPAVKLGTRARVRASVGRVWAPIKTRLADRAKWPRCWWHPLPPPPDERLTPEQWKEQHDEVSGTIRRVMMVLLGYSFFCILTLGAPDASLVSANAKIKIPFADTEIAFSSFILIGPLVLLGVASYLHLFVGKWLELNHHPLSKDQAPIPYAFNMRENRLAHLFSTLVFYWLVPLILGYFAYKASPQPDGWQIASLAACVAAAFLYLHVRRDMYGSAHKGIRAVRRFAVIALAFLAYAGYEGRNLFQRQLNLFGAKLASEDLRRANLSGIDPRQADLQGTNLARADLRDADLRGALLSGAEFQGARLRGAVLNSLDLSGAMNLSQEQINAARGDSHAVLPAGLTRPKHWPAAELRGHTGTVMHAEFSPDGSRIVTASWDSTARVWEAASGELVVALEGHTSAVRHSAFSPDGSRIVTASSDDTARVWEAASGELVVALEGHTSAVRHSAFSPDGSRIVTASSDDTARVWEAASGELVVALEGHTSAVRHSAFSPDGSRIVTASSDDTPRVWEAASGELVVAQRATPARLRTRRFRPTAAASSPPALTIRRGSGRRPAASWSSLWRATPARLSTRRFRPTAAASSPPVGTIRRGSGRRPAASWSWLWRATPTWLGTRRFRPTAAASSPPAGTIRRASGKCADASHVSNRVALG